MLSEECHSKSYIIALRAYAQTLASQLAASLSQNRRESSFTADAYCTTAPPSAPASGPAPPARPTPPAPPAPAPIVVFQITSQAGVFFHGELRAAQLLSDDLVGHSRSCVRGHNEVNALIAYQLLQLFPRNGGLSETQHETDEKKTRRDRPTNQRQAELRTKVRR